MGAAGEVIKVVFDANVFVSFFLTPGTTISKIFALWQEKKIEVLISREIKNEFFKVFEYPKIKKYLKIHDFEALRYLLGKQTKLIFPKKRIYKCEDIFDNMYLECCLEGKVDYLITGDKKHLLPIKKFNKTEIVSPKQFVKIYTPGAS